MTRTLGLLLGAATVVAAVGVKLSGGEPRERERERQGRDREPQAAHGACGQQRRARQQLVFLGEHARPVDQAPPWRRQPARAVPWRSVPTGGLGGRAREHDTPDSAGAVLQAPAGLEHEAGGESGARIQNED